MDWRPTLKDREGPLYRRIVDALTADVASGRLRRGQQLPTHRALAKALGAPAGMAWHDAEVQTDAGGRPYFVITGTVENRARALGVRQVHLSLSHDAGIASAMVVCEG